MFLGVRDEFIFPEPEINEIIGIFAEAAGKKAEKVTFLDDCTVLDPDMLR